MTEGPKWCLGFWVTAVWLWKPGTILDNESNFKIFRFDWFCFTFTCSWLK